MTRRMKLSKTNSRRQHAPSWLLMDKDQWDHKEASIGGKGSFLQRSSDPRTLCMSMQWSGYGEYGQIEGERSYRLDYVV